MKTIAMRTVRPFMQTALVAGLTVLAGAQQGAPATIAATTDDTFLIEAVAAKPNLEPASVLPR